MYFDSICSVDYLNYDGSHINKYCNCLTMSLPDNWCEFPVPSMEIMILPHAAVEITSDYTLAMTSHFLYY